MKEPLFTLLRDEVKGNAQQLADLTWTVTKLLDKLGLYTVEVYAQSREAILKRQSQELLELSTPVVELWDKIVAIPLIGTLDSERTQTVMENLLNHIVKSHAQIGIIDITGVPTVDTLVAQHLIKTVSAARLMGADLHHQRHPPADRPDHRASGVAARCRLKGHDGGCFRVGVEAHGAGHRSGRREVRTTTLRQGACATLA